VQISEQGLTLGDATWDATCHGIVYNCTRMATGYGTSLSCKKSRQQPEKTEPAATPVSADKLQASPAAKAPLAATETAASLEVRAALDRERDAILACGRGGAMGVKALIQADHTPDVHLTGDLAGSPEEACVRSLLFRLVLPGASPGTFVIHVVR
jgi:hypothetical protein